MCTDDEPLYGGDTNGRERARAASAIRLARLSARWECVAPVLPQAAWCARRGERLQASTQRTAACHPVAHACPWLRARMHESAVHSPSSLTARRRAGLCVHTHNHQYQYQCQYQYQYQCCVRACTEEPRVRASAPRRRSTGSRYGCSPCGPHVQRGPWSTEASESTRSTPCGAGQVQWRAHALTLTFSTCCGTLHRRACDTFAASHRCTATGKSNGCATLRVFGLHSID